MTGLLLWLAVHEPVAMLEALCVLSFGLWFGARPVVSRTARRLRGVSRRSQLVGLDHLARIAAEQATPSAADTTDAFPAVKTLPFPAAS